MKPTTRGTCVRLATRLNLFRTLVVAFGLLLLLPSAKAQFTWPVYEPFGEYQEGENLGTNGDSLTYWDVGNGGTNGVSSFIITSAAAMSFPALIADTNSDPKGVMSQYQPNTSADRGFLFTTNNLGSGAIYASFLLNYIDNGAATAFPYDRPCFNLATGATDESGGSFGAVFSSVWLTADYRLKIAKDWQNNGVFSGTSPVIATNVPHLIVVRYKVVTGGNDEMDLWIDPTPFGDDTQIPPPTLVTTNGANLTNFNAIILNSRKTSPPTPPFIPTAHLFYVDEIRAGDTFSSVTPLATAAPGPIFTVTGGGTTCPSSPPDVALSGSVSSNVYLLYTNDVYSASLPGTGSALDFGLQSVEGVYSVLASNTATADIGWMSNSVTVALIQPPNIVAEPNPVVTATNNRAEFTVTSGGSGLGYQWYQDGTPLVNGSGITGALSNDLVIWPATVANVGNYYCIITNSCGLSSTTTTNSLTLDAPNNLLWVGDAFSLNVWALANINYQNDWQAGGNPAVFNGGDNVTFDDTYPYSNPVTLTNTLTPSTITVNGTRTYVFGGKGIIAGSGSLLMNSSGVLSLSNDTSGTFSNNFSGGTVISNGTINVSASWTTLGTGPVTLAGGTLESFQKGSGTGTSPSSGLVPNLYVIANSTWQVDRTGNQCAGLVGGLLGSPGTTLLITNSAVTSNSVNTIRFGGVFTNYSAIITAVNSITSNSSMTIATFHSGNTNVEIFNGPISGPTAAFQVSGSGSVYLNGANTYANLTTVSAGLLAGSGSINGSLTNASGGTIGGGPVNAIGTFSVNGSVTNGGKVFIRVNKSLAQSNDLISVTGFLTNSGTGTVTITNIGGASLVTGDRFQIFSKAIQNGAALAVTGGGVTWSNNLAVDGSVQVIPSFVFLTSSPTITNLSLQSLNAVVSGTNGQTGATAYLLTATNVAEPLNQWHTVGTDILGGSSFSFTATNAVNTGDAQQFFMLSSTNYNP